MMKLSQQPEIRRTLLAALMALTASCAQQPASSGHDSDPACLDGCHQVDSLDTPGPCGGECHEAANDTGLEDDLHAVHDRVHDCTVCHDM